jgi:hypothetical protein
MEIPHLEIKEMRIRVYHIYRQTVVTVVFDGIYDTHVLFSNTQRTMVYENVKIKEIRSCNEDCKMNSSAPIHKNQCLVLANLI